MILNDEWIANLFKKRKEMNSSYETELEDLKKVYENAVNQFNNAYDFKLKSLVSFMKDFISSYENKKLYECKLEALNVKLNNECCDCNDDYEQDEEDDE